jgi:hypothetical protein
MEFLHSRLHLLSEWSFQKLFSIEPKLKKGDLMMKLVFKVAMLVMITIGLTPLQTKTTSLAAPAPASAAVACDLQSCMTKCVKLGYLGGTCGSITHTCVCYSYPPPPNQEP